MSKLLLTALFTASVAAHAGEPSCLEKVTKVAEALAVSQNGSLMMSSIDEIQVNDHKYVSFDLFDSDGDPGYLSYRIEVWDTEGYPCLIEGIVLTQSGG